MVSEIIKQPSSRNQFAIRGKGGGIICIYIYTIDLFVKQPLRNYHFSFNQSKLESLSRYKIHVLVLSKQIHGNKQIMFVYLGNFQMFRPRNVLNCVRNCKMLVKEIIYFRDKGIF